MNADKEKWINFVSFYIKEAQPSSINLNKDRVKIAEFKTLLECLPGSEVQELTLSNNNLENGMGALIDVLVISKIRKLDVSNCQILKTDILLLMEILKFTEIRELDIRYNKLKNFTVDERDKFISYMLESNLEVFNFDLDDFEEVGMDRLLEGIISSKITGLDLKVCLSHTSLIFLLKNLYHSSLTHLSIKGIEFDEYTMRIFSQALRESELKKLDLSSNNLNDNMVNILAEGLTHSKIIDLNLGFNKIWGSNTLGLYLKDTPIQILKLHMNYLREPKIFVCFDHWRQSSVVTLSLMFCKIEDELFQQLVKCLKFSKVTELDVSCCNVQLRTIFEFAEILKDTQLERVNFSRNILSAEALVILSTGIKNSKLKHIDLSGCFDYPNGGATLPLLLSEIKGSNLDSLAIRCDSLTEAEVKIFAMNLDNTSISKLSLSFTEMRNGIKYFAEHLKFTNLSHLNLSCCQILDEGVKVLAKHLKETRLIELDLSFNRIANLGAVALALSLKESNLLYLYLSGNKIKNHGITALAQGAENTFITKLKISDKPSEYSHLIDTVLLRNKLLVHRLINTFKRIAPKVGNTSFGFSKQNNFSDERDLLENCLELYMNIVYKPAAIRVLTEDTNIPFSREQIVALMEEEFPKQFCLFITIRVEANVEEHVNLLRKAEDWRLKEIVELLLRNRPLYLIDKSYDILHPFLYKLLLKYNHPICNSVVEPEGKLKIIKFFTTHKNIDGASDVIHLLQKNGTSESQPL